MRLSRLKLVICAAAAAVLATVPARAQVQMGDVVKMYPRSGGAPVVGRVVRAPADSLVLYREGLDPYAVARSDVAALYRRQGRKPGGEAALRGAAFGAIIMPLVAGAYTAATLPDDCDGSNSTNCNAGWDGLLVFVVAVGSIPFGAAGGAVIGYAARGPGWVAVHPNVVQPAVRPTVAPAAGGGVRVGLTLRL